MRQPVDEETLRRLGERANALEARTTRPVRDYGANAVGVGYKLLAQLLGGTLVGLGLGAAVDALAHTLPWGLIAGVLVGSGTGMVLAVRGARLASDQAAKEMGPARSIPFDDDEESPD